MTQRDLMDFVTRLRARETLIGTFVKSRAYECVEIAGESPLDFVVLDAEHAPLGRADLDAQLLAARAGSLPAVVRVPNSAPDAIGAPLDMGASGVMIPHVTDVAVARSAVAATRYRDGVRGFSNSPRAGRYGSVPFAEHIANADSRTIVVCQIEDRAGVENVDAIATVPGVDVLFIGRADLAVAYDAASLDDLVVERAVTAILDAGTRHGVTTGLFLPDARQVARFRERGASVFVIGSDQSVLRTGFAGLAATAREPT